MFPSINTEKTRLIVGKGKKIVTGITVSDTKAKLPREMKRELRQEFHCIRKHGLISHMTSLKIRNPKYLPSLIGKFSFWLQVEPENVFAKNAKKYLLNSQISSA